MKSFERYLVPVKVIKKRRREIGKASHKSKHSWVYSQFKKTYSLILILATESVNLVCTLIFIYLFNFKVW